MCVNCNLCTCCQSLNIVHPRNKHDGRQECQDQNEEEIA